MKANRIVIVTGLARCGTSMTMRMLYAGGAQVSCDNLVSYEWNDGRTTQSEREKFLAPIAEPGHWLEGCCGKAVKILDPHIYQPPAGLQYDFVLCTRNPREQAKSMIKFLRAVEPMLFVGRSNDWRTMAHSLMDDYSKLEKWLKRSYLGSQIMTQSFEGVLANPLRAAKLLNEMCGPLNVMAMADAVHKRSPLCLPNLNHELTALNER